MIVMIFFIAISIIMNRMMNIIMTMLMNMTLWQAFPLQYSVPLSQASTEHNQPGSSNDDDNANDDDDDCCES